MNVREFEDAVWQKEKIRIAIRASSSNQVEGYDYVNAANANQSLASFLNARVLNKVGDLEVIAINGDGEIVNGNTHLDTIRGTYGV